MKTINGIEELNSLIGQELGVSEWLTITQERINAFADATGDHQWIHVDAEKAAKLTPFGSTIAHGFLTLSLMPQFSYELYEIKGVQMALNYGTNKVRFISPVPVNSRIRMRATLQSVEPVEGGVQMTVLGTFEREGQEKPVCVAEALTRIYL